MGRPMKRKQFHLSPVEDEILRKLSQQKSISEAELVRMAIRDFGYKNLSMNNSLVEMAKKAQEESSNSPEDLSVHHDRYLTEIHENEK